VAAPTYTNDLTTIVDFDGTPSSPTVAEPSTGWTAGRSPTVDTDFPIQSTNHCSLTMNTTGQAGVLCSNASSFSWTSGDYLFGWLVWLAPGAIAGIASGGLAMLCGDGTSSYKVFYVGGSDSGNSPYGGWQNFAVDPTMSHDEIFGSPSAYYIVGSGANVLSAVSKGNPLGFDVFRYGRGTLYIDDGQSGSYATFAGVATANDASAARWGLFQAISGGYKQKGILSFGENSYCEFIDSNKSIVIDDSKYVGADFNRIEVYNTSSKVYWTNVSVRSLCTVSPGRFEMMAAADVQFDGCTFINMDTFIFMSSAQVTNGVFQSCKAVTGAGATFTSTKFLTPTVAADASALIWNVSTDLDGKIDGATFSKGTNAHHAIELGVSSTNNLTIRNVTFSGFNTSDAQNDSVLYLADKGSDTTWTIGCVGCSGTVSYKKARSGDTVNITQGVALTVHVIDANTGSDIENARVLVAANTGGPKPYQASVGLTRSGSTVTVAHTGHGLSTNDWVVIAGANEWDYNGVWQITVTGVDAYTFNIGSKTPSSPATGSPVATFAPIHGLTNSSGIISDTRTYASNQPIYGRVRKASSSPYYKTSPISGEIDSSTGASITVQMVSET
jgi:hypothetical protein